VRFLERLPIQRKLFILAMAPTLMALILACLLLFIFDVTVLQQSLKERITLSAGYVANALGQPLRWSNAKNAVDALNMLNQNPDVIAACVYDADGKILGRYYRDHTPIDFPESPSDWAELSISGGRLQVFHPIEAINQRIGTLYILADVAFLHYRMQIYGLGVLLIMIVSATLAYLLSTRLQELIARPITHLSLLAKVVTEEKDYSVRAVRETEDEIGNLVDEFNTMLTQIERRDRALQDAHDQLEDRVKHRTKELQQEIIEHKRTAASLQQEIGERRRAQTELQHAIEAAEASSRSKGEFLANMSHEIRTPMNGIIGMTEVLLNTRLTSSQHKYADAIRRSGRALLKIIGDILDYSKVEAGQLVIEPIPFDLQVACEDVIEMLSTRADEKGLALILRYAPETPRRVVGDAGRIRQVLTNLVSNAIKFTAEGYVLVNVECTGLTSETAAIRATVEDTGIGTPPDKMQEIFAKYTQANPWISRQYGGTGLGLAISKQLVELMGGSIGVQSSEGTGSRFYFTLFLPVGKSAPPSSQHRADLTGVRVLVVDPSPVNRQVLIEQFSAWGMFAYAVGSSSEAIEVLRAARKQDTAYHITLIDDQMPGIHGESLGRALKAEPDLKDTLLVLVTSMGQRGDAQRMLELGFSAYLTRPIRQSELMDAFATIWAAHLKGEDVGLITRHTIAESREASAPERTHLAPGTRILVAEDNAVNQQVALEILQSFDCVVTLANDGLEAVERARSERFDLILMDCQMPRKDGYQATQEIRVLEGEGQHIPIVAMTAHAMKGDRERCLAAGMDDYVSKPVDPHSLMDVLSRWLPEAADSEDSGAASPVVKDAALSIPEPQPSLGPACVLNLQQALWVTGGRMATFRRIAMVFVQHMPNRIQELREALRQNDLQEINRLSHSIKGASASVGGERLRDAAFAMEMQSRQGIADDLAGGVMRVETEFEALRMAIETFDWSRCADEPGGEAAAAKNTGRPNA
jgi:signal transduction histidine kinase/DNA-binding response OmpR family regulator/HPt (histidine-containing phosphotransfer) domain-containing protein